jgi:cullin 3
VEFVQRLLNMKDKFDRIIEQSFNADRSFQQTLNQVCAQAAQARPA